MAASKGATVDPRELPATHDRYMAVIEVDRLHKRYRDHIAVHDVSFTVERARAQASYVERWEVAVVALPLMLLAAVATHFSARHSLRQQPVDGPLAAIMRWTPWVFPLGVLIGGAFFPFPIAILLYWLANNVWTLVQQWIVFRPALDPPLQPAAAGARPPT